MRYTLKIDTILICFDTYDLAFKFTVFILLFLLVTLQKSSEVGIQQILDAHTNDLKKKFLNITVDVLRWTQT